MSQVFTPAEVKQMLTRHSRNVRGVSVAQDRTYAGRVYHSKNEAKYAFGLDALKSAGRILKWERQVVVEIVVNGVKICKLKVDFKVWPLAGNPWLIEIKGHETEVYRLKRKLLRACHPELDYRVVKV